MSDTSKFRVTSKLALATVALMFGLIVLGSIVRTTGSGLACPDWPLCQGRLFPPFQFNAMIEWFHRLVALLVSLLLVSTVGWVMAHPPLRARLGGLAVLAAGLLAAQVLLGALTVWKLLDPAVVGGHLGVALLLFSTLLAIALVAAANAEPDRAILDERPAGLLPLFSFAAAAIYGQSLLGGIVSAHAAGLACPDWPTCGGLWFPPMQGNVGLQVAHRWGAYGLVALMMVVALRARVAADPVIARVGSLLLALALGQIALGVANVVMGLTVWLSAAHLANAAGMLALTIASTFRLASAPAARSALTPAVTS